ncbi:site-specific DNA-methyltransferase [candidate division KSB1 bacterium]|nr:site-specific DNA-methyltransferase [candidate division KSB1 bacterium]
MTEPEKLDLRSHDLAEDKKQELLRLFPEIRTEDGKIDFERLKLALGEIVDVGKERYGMNWPGKADCFKTIQAPSLGTLLPCREESANFDATENLIIEGDNLEVLKLLQKSYLGKVKMIYIDPPYNTGNDFIYPDNYTESLQTYLEYTGQVDAEGRKFSTNTEADGRFHSKWLNMMYPRLYLARNLLRDDGVIFVSIDDAEGDNLKKICNEVFGEENFIGLITWRARNFADARPMRGLSVDHEYVAIYGKNIDARISGKRRDEGKYSNPDNDPRGPWTSCSLLGKATKEQRPNLHYDVVHPQTGEIFPDPPETGWICRPETFQKKIEEGRILWPKKVGGRPREKVFLSELQSGVLGFPSVLDGIFTSDGTEEMRGIFQNQIFQFPKPSLLIRDLLLQGLANGEIVLDFFSGSGTTAQAVLELNNQDGGNRKFILVQLPEPTGRKDFPTIADITKERVRRVIQKLAQNQKEKEKTPELELGVAKSSRENDLGFKVFKLAESNFKTWKANIEPGNTAALQEQLELHVDHLREGRTNDDILYEILIKSGYPLTTPVETLTLAGKKIYSAQTGAFLICLERELTLELIRAMAERKPERVVCLDEGFSDNDQLKANAVQIFKTKGVTSFKTV